MDVPEPCTRRDRGAMRSTVGAPGAHLTDQARTVTDGHGHVHVHVLVRRASSLRFVLVDVSVHGRRDSGLRFVPVGRVRGRARP